MSLLNYSVHYASSRKTNLPWKIADCSLLPLSASFHVCGWKWVFMPRLRLRMHSEVYGSVFVHVCVECYNCSVISEVKVRVSIALLSLILAWIGIAKQCFVLASFLTTLKGVGAKSSR